jgi:hypothetical protein
MPFPRRLGAAIVSIGVLLGSAALAAAADDLVSKLGSGTATGVRFEVKPEGYEIVFEEYIGEPVRSLTRWTAVPKPPERRATVSVKAGMWAGSVGDTTLIFGASDKAYYYLVAHQDPAVLRWSLGHFNADASPQRQQLAGDASDALDTLEEGNELRVTILSRDGEKPLLTVEINRQRVAELPALHDEDSPMSPFGGVGVEATGYSSHGQAGYLFWDLTVTPDPPSDGGS